MNILITGGAGFVGSHLCEKYTNEENNVVCLDNGVSFERVEHLSGKKGFWTAGINILDRSMLTNSVGNNDLDAVIHLAAQVRIDMAKSLPINTWEINVNGTLNLLELARRFDVPKFLFASSSEIYGSAQYLPMGEDHPLGTTSIYGASKIAGDRLCHTYAKTYGMDIGILRPFNIYGPGQIGAGVIPLFIEKVLSGHPPVIQGDGSQTRDYLFIDDMVSGYDAMLHAHDTGAVNFGTGVGTSVKTIAETVIEVCGAKLQPIYEGKPANTTSDLVANITRARVVLDWKPQVSLFDGIHRYAKWFNERGRVIKV